MFYNCKLSLIVVHIQDLMGGPAPISFCKFLNMFFHGIKRWCVNEHIDVSRIKKENTRKILNILVFSLHVLF